MVLIECLKERCKKQKDIKPLLQILGNIYEEEFQRPLCELTNDQTTTLILTWLAWHREKTYVKLRIIEENEQQVYEAGMLLKRGRICVRYIRKVPELKNKLLYHWHYDINHEMLSAKEIKNGIENADILNLIDTEYEIPEDINDFDLEGIKNAVS